MIYYHLPYDQCLKMWKEQDLSTRPQSNLCDKIFEVDEIHFNRKALPLNFKTMKSTMPIARTHGSDWLYTQKEYLIHHSDYSKFFEEL